MRRPKRKTPAEEKGIEDAWYDLLTLVEIVDAKLTDLGMPGSLAELPERLQKLADAFEEEHERAETRAHRSGH